MNENEKIKEIRKELGLTQQEMADSIGVSKQYFSKVENGLTDLSKEKIVKLCMINNISLNWLLLGQGGIFLSQEEDNNEVGEDARDILDFFKFERNLQLYSMYVIAATEMIRNKYTNAIMKDIVEATRQLYSIDISLNWTNEEYDEAIKEFTNKGKLYNLFKDRILRVYCRTTMDNEKEKLKFKQNNNVG